MMQKVYYVGGIVYEGDTIDFFATDEGRVKRLENGSLRYEYNLTDHLGNVRLSFTKGANGTTPEVLQEDHYYPFGMKLKGLSKVESGQKENKFTYNGKELEDDHGLNWHHYGARYYDPQLGRWHTMDPVNQYYSPYVYVGNNPVLFLDPDGQEPGSPFDDPERILRDQVEKGYLPAEHGEAMIQGYNRGLQIAAIVGTAALAVYGAVLYGPELFYAVSTWFLSNPQRAENVVETAIDIAADSYRPDPGDVLEVTGKKGLNTSIEISESLAENFTGNELNWFIGKQQRELIKEFFGQGLEGALKRKENFEVPKDLTRESLEAYRAAALKIMQEVKDNPNVQAVQRARIELIDRALKEIE